MKKVVFNILGMFPILLYAVNPDDTLWQNAPTQTENVVKTSSWNMLWALLITILIIFTLYYLYRKYRHIIMPDYSDIKKIPLSKDAYLVEVETEKEKILLGVGNVTVISRTKKEKTEEDKLLEDEDFYSSLKKMIYEGKEKDVLEILKKKAEEYEEEG